MYVSTYVGGRERMRPVGITAIVWHSALSLLLSPSRVRAGIPESCVMGPNSIRKSQTHILYLLILFVSMQLNIRNSAEQQYGEIQASKLTFPFSTYLKYVNTESSVISNNHCPLCFCSFHLPVVNYHACAIAFPRCELAIKGFPASDNLI